MTPANATYDAILFDLDGTLLDIDFTALMRDYLRELAPVASEIFGLDPEQAVAVVFEGTDAMATDHPGVLNKEVFDSVAEERTGIDIRTPEHQEVFDRFYSDVFPRLSTSHGPIEGARELLEALIERGVPFAIATQPYFPRLATQARLEWAGIADLELPLVTTYENSTAAKPRPAYFLEIAEKLGVDPTRCLMIGDDPELDMPSSQVGMTTWYVGDDPTVEADHRGSIVDLARHLGLTSGDIL